MYNTLPGQGLGQQGNHSLLVYGLGTVFLNQFPPASRIYDVRAESRLCSVSARSRVYDINDEDRSYDI